MKYMIMLFGTQLDHDRIAGRGKPGETTFAPADVEALHRFMADWNNRLVDSGEFVDGQGLAEPVHTRRVELRDGAPVVTDGPYAETEEVLAGYTIVDCDSFDRATEIAAELADTPHPDGMELEHEWFVDVRPIAGAPGPDPES